MGNDLLEMFEEDSIEKKIEVPRTEKLEELSKLIDKMSLKERRIAELEEELSIVRNEFNEINSMKIPDLFDELGLRKLSLKDGKVVEVKLKYAASISEENSEDCFEWLHDNNHEAIIKHEVKVDIKKGEEEEYEQLMESLTDIGVSFKDRSYVHPQTLSSFVKEQIENGTDFPKELFKVYPLRTTKVK